MMNIIGIIPISMYYVVYPIYIHEECISDYFSNYQKCHICHKIIKQDKLEKTEEIIGIDYRTIIGILTFIVLVTSFIWAMIIFSKLDGDSILFNITIGIIICIHISVCCSISTLDDLMKIKEHGVDHNDYANISHSPTKCIFKYNNRYYMCSKPLSNSNFLEPCLLGKNLDKSILFVQLIFGFIPIYMNICANTTLIIMYYNDIDHNTILTIYCILLIMVILIPLLKFIIYTILYVIWLCIVAVWGEIIKIICKTKKTYHIPSKYEITTVNNI